VCVCEREREREKWEGGGGGGERVCVFVCVCVCTCTRPKASKQKYVPSGVFFLLGILTRCLPGQSAELDDYTEIYAPPEAPDPDPAFPFAYDVYSVAIIGLRWLE